MLDDTPETEKHTAVNLPPCASYAEECRAAITFPENLRGKKVLEIGSGLSDCTHWLRTQGADAYAVDLVYRSMYETTYHAKILTPKLKPNERTIENFVSDIGAQKDHYIAALAGYLPFKDNSFDFVFSINCLIWAAFDENYAVTEKQIEEAIRVLKHGGMLQIYPYIGCFDGTARQVHNDLFKYFERKGLCAYQERVSLADRRLVVEKRSTD